jgi:hypothetical protein
MPSRALTRAALCAAALAGTAACASPTFSATGVFANDKGPACVYCASTGGGSIPDWQAPQLFDRAPRTGGTAGQATR